VAGIYGARALSPNRFRLAEGDCALQLDELDACFEFPADCNVVFVALAGFFVDPREAATCRRIVRLVVDGAATTLMKRASFVTNARSPFAPASSLDEAAAQMQFDCRGLVFGERRAVRAAGGAVRARITGQLG